MEVRPGDVSGPEAGAACAEGSSKDGARRKRSIRRWIRDLQVHFVSLVPAAANERTFLVKSGMGSGLSLVEKEIGFAQQDATRHMVYGIVYAPAEADAHGDGMQPEEIERAAYRFLQGRRTQQVDADHDGVGGRGFVAESWIVRSGDPLFPEEVPGAWAVGIKVTDGGTWERIEAGDLRGLSMAGLAHVTPTAADEAGVLDRLRKRLGMQAPDRAPSPPASQTSAQEADAATESLRDLLLRTERMAARLDALERYSPGRSSVLGAEQRVRKEEGFRGIQIL